MIYLNGELEMKDKYDYSFKINEKDVNESKTSHEMILHQINPNSKVLECGPADGIMTQYIKEVLKCNVYVIEIDNISFEKVMRYADFGVCADLDQNDWMDQIPENSFDYIIFADVLEHLRNPKEVLSKIQRFLKDDGSILLSIPNLAHGDVVANLLCDRFHYTSLGLLDDTHLHLFTQTEIHQMIKEAGLYLAEETCTICPPFSSEQAKYLSEVEKKGYTGVAYFSPLSNAYQFICRVVKKRVKTVSDVIDRCKKNCINPGKIYLDKGKGYSEEDVIIPDLSITSEGYIYRVELSHVCDKVRFDPIENKCIIVKVKIFLNGNEIIEYSTNGVQIDDSIFFTHDDPQIDINVLGKTGELEIHLELTRVIFEKIDIAREFLEKTVEKMGHFSQQETLMHNEHDILKNQLENRNKYIAEIEHTINLFQDKLYDYTDQIKVLQTKTDELNARNTNLLAQNGELNARNTNLLAQNGELNARNNNLETQNNELNKQIENVNDRLRSTENAYLEIRNAFFWRITKPFRVVIESLRKLRAYIGDVFSLVRKAFSAFRNGGLKNVIYRYKVRKERLLREKNPIGVFSDNNPLLPEPVIPEEWLNIQKNKPLVSVIIAAKDMKNRIELLQAAIHSVEKQIYHNTEIMIVTDDADKKAVQGVIKKCKDSHNIKMVSLLEPSENEWVYYVAGVSEAKGELIGFLEQEETLTKNAIAYVIEAYNESVIKPKSIFIIPDEVHMANSDLEIKDEKAGVGWQVGGTDSLLHFGVFRKKDFNPDKELFDNWLLSLKRDDVFISPWVGVHETACDEIWNKQNVRTLAFYLPQFHETPENNEFWGKGFTEWTNVKKATPLYKGHHQPRKPTEMGYYDLGDECGTEVQKKQIQLAKEYGLFGFCYYYYWFDGGKRMLEKPLDRHVNDKTMDFPFCLCWANENWTRQWDGQQTSVLIPQTYKKGWAESFIRDMIPYLKDDRYIKVNGAPYILVYNIWDIPNSAEAINTWRRIAEEEGIGRLHISAVRRKMDSSELAYSGHTLDSLTDFPPHLLGEVGVDSDDYERFGLKKEQIKDYRKACRYHAEMPKQNYTYFRTVMLEWDNTARRGEKAYIFEHYSLEVYKKWLYAAKRYTMRQNRPGEDLLFINAWNEWAEGTYLEPSEPDDRGALQTTLEVLKMR